MIYKLLLKAAESHSEKLFIADNSGELTYAEASHQVTLIAQTLQRMKMDRIYFYVKDSRCLIITLIAADLLGIEACVLNRQFSIQEVEGIIGRIGNGYIISDLTNDEKGNIQNIIRQSDQNQVKNASNIRPVKNRPSNVMILTSGTTDKPKAVLYTWERLAAQGRIISEKETTGWLLAYPLNHFAGIQMIIHVLLNKNSLIIPDSWRFDDILNAARRYGVNSISATPTFWRMFAGRITSAQAQSISLKQITLGGEASTSELLEKLRKLFPGASISQVYATTEIGSCFSVKDGCPGFPKNYLNKTIGNVDLKIIDGELYVKSQNCMIGYINQEDKPQISKEFVGTGDLVEIIGDRVFFVGRKSEVINVGGVKVYPLKVEEVISKIAGVQTVRVYGRANPVTGQIVVADIEIAQKSDTSKIINATRQHCRIHLSRYEQPRDIRVVASLPKQNEKIVRRNLNAQNSSS